ncbi:hypothetical protein IKD57_01260 [Candidatus Saccharibacteria bacterium]|nr:hypothetical protein [Candidatus Saccharibacteria bacterium]
MNGENFNSNNDQNQRDEWRKIAQQIASHTTTDGHGENVYLGRELPEEMQGQVEAAGFEHEPEAPRGSSEDSIIDRETYPQKEGESNEEYESRINEMQTKTDEFVRSYEKETAEQERKNLLLEQERETYLNQIRYGILDVNDNEQIEKYNSFNKNKDLKDRIFIAAARGTQYLNDKKKVKEYIEFFNLAEADPVKLLRVFNYDAGADTDYSTSKSRNELYLRLQDDNELGKNGTGIARYNCIDYLTESNKEWYENCKEAIKKELDLFMQKLLELCGGDKKTVWFDEDRTLNEGHGKFTQVDVFGVDEYDSYYFNENGPIIKEKVNESILDIVSPEKIREELSKKGIKFKKDPHMFSHI